MISCAVGGELSGIVGPCISYGALLQCTVLVSTFPDNTATQLNTTMDHGNVQRALLTFYARYRPSAPLVA